MVRCLLCSHQFCTFMWPHANGEHAGAAMRRRQRRLRQWLRHERLSVAMLLAETQHLAAPRGQTMARAGGGGSRRTTRPSSGSTHPPGARHAVPRPRRRQRAGSSEAPGQTGSLLCLVRSSGFSGTPWSRWLTARRSCRCLKLLCR